MNIFATIRQRCAEVADQATSVVIDEDALARFADQIPRDRLARPAMDDEHHLVGRGDDTVAYILVLDAVNFGSGYFPTLHPVDGRRGYFMVARALRDHFASSGAPTAEELTRWTPADCATLFGQPLDESGPRELMELFSRALRDLGGLVDTEFGGSFTALVAAANHRASSLVEILGQMPLYRDVATYRGKSVPLYKRAQITVADLHLALRGEGLGRFDDLQELTIFADNQVPHVLRVAGALSYTKDLADGIESGELLPAGSPKEVEIRAVSLHAVELLTARLNADGAETTTMAVDNYLWDIGERPPYSDGKKHRTRTTFY